MQQDDKVVAPQRLATDWLVGMLCSAAVASAWRGSWLILDAWLWPQQPLGSAALSLALGAAIFALLLAAQQPLHLRAASWARGAWAADAAFSYLGGWVGVLAWRGVWQLWDCSSGIGLAPSERGAVANLQLGNSGVVSHVAGAVVLFAVGMLRSLNAPPTLVSLDRSLPLLGAVVIQPAQTIDPLRRLRAPPRMLAHGEWLAAVGLQGRPCSRDPAALHAHTPAPPASRASSA